MAYDKKPLWLIQPRLDAAVYRDLLIGSVVKYPDLPTESRVPFHGKPARELVADLDPVPVQVRNVKFWTRNIKDASISATVNDLLEGFMERAKEESSEKVATVARVWHMDSPGERFKELLKNRAYFEELFELLKSNRYQGYFITDIVTLMNLEIRDEEGTSKGVGAGAKVVEPNTGLNIGGSARIQAQREKGYSASYESETIVFIGYRQIRLEKVDGTRARLSRFFKGQQHGFAVRDEFDYWPDLVDRPYEGNTEGFLGARTPTPEDENKQLTKEEADQHGIMGVLGFDVEIVG